LAAGNLAITDLEDQQYDRAEPYLRERLRHAMAVGDTGAIRQTYNLLLRIFILARMGSSSEDGHCPPAFRGAILYLAFEDGWLAEQEGNPRLRLSCFASA